MHKISDQNNEKQATAPLELLTIPEVAQLLKISTQTVRRLQQQRRIPFYKAGGGVRFRRSDIVAYVESTKVKAIDR